jgi:hypothetical protein
VELIEQIGRQPPPMHRVHPDQGGKTKGVTVQPDPEPVEYVVERVREAVAQSAVHELGVTVQAAGGRLLLTGTASSEAQRDAITTVVADAAPGWDVVNELRVAPTTPPEEVERL